jgi:undecaprenyl diphosphate synthase
MTSPKHIAIIMDGNRRWAKQHKIEILKGHEYVANKVIEDLAVHCIKRGVQYLTLWAFSTENWNRDQEEVLGLMNIFRSAFSKSAQRLHELNIKLNVIGDMSKFPQDIQENTQQWLAESSNNTQLTVSFALNYGGRNELVRAFRKIASQVAAGEIAADQVNDELISQSLDTAELPDPDLLIRPGGEKRLSGLMPWQTVYTELYFTDVLMPDFGPDELDKALEDYRTRQRRFGK